MIQTSIEPGRLIDYKKKNLLTLISTLKNISRIITFSKDDGTSEDFQALGMIQIPLIVPATTDHTLANTSWRRDYNCLDEDLHR